MNLPSKFQVDILVENSRYRYGFSLDSAEVVEEWLYAYPPQGHRQLWFKRQGRTFDYGKNLSGQKKTIESLTRKDSLFLSAAAQNNHEMLVPIYTWFSKHLKVVMGVRSHLSTLTQQLCANDTFRSTAQSLLTDADLGVVGMKVGKEGLGDSLPLRPKDGAFSTAELEYFPKISLEHRGRGANVPLDLEDESNGTKVLFEILGTLMMTLREGGTLVIDELDSSLHPLLALHLIELFNNDRSNTGKAQLIFNTHDTTLLSGSLLRRDQVWFAEKGVDGATRLYPLTEFQPRKGENLQRGYLQGRYGAIPFLGSTAFLAEAETHNEKV